MFIYIFRFYFSTLTCEFQVVSSLYIRSKSEFFSSTCSICVDALSVFKWGYIYIHIDERERELMMFYGCFFYFKINLLYLYSRVSLCECVKITSGL